MDYLTLCQRVGAESGTLPEGAMSTVVDVTGRLAKVARWTNEAWRAIQKAHRDWLWMRGEFIGTLSPTVQRYEGATFLDFDTNATITRFGSFICTMNRDENRFAIYDPLIGLSDKGFLMFVPWNEFYRTRVNSTIENGKPRHFSIDAQGRICFSPIPDQAYTVLGPYRKSVMSLVANSDEPDMPEAWHELIVQVACQFMETSDEADAALISMRQLREVREYSSLERDQLPNLGFGGPLA